MIRGLSTGGIVAATVERMPAAVRSTGLAFACNASIGGFGGGSLMIVAWLLDVTGAPISPAYRNNGEQLADGPIDHAGNAVPFHQVSDTVLPF
jgi:hypothetical protein